jgi:hypothetical protein
MRSSRSIACSTRTAGRLGSVGGGLRACGRAFGAIRGVGVVAGNARRSR